MQENSAGLKITYAKNLDKYNFNLPITVPVDNNIHIKKILDIESYVFDDRLECGNSKAVYAGKVGIKVLYLDQDNVAGTLTNDQSFSETIVDSSITSDCYICNVNTSIQNNLISFDSNIKLSLEITLSNVLYLNMPMNANTNQFENMIVKKSEINTYTIHDHINTSFEYTTNLECKENLSKILSYNAYFTPTNVTAENGYAVIEGKIYSTLIYECMKDEDSEILELTDFQNIKQELNLEKLEKDCVLDLNFSLDKSKEVISSEVEDGTNEITISHTIKVSGVSLNSISIDVIDDIYSVDNDVDITLNTREYNKSVQCNSFSDDISSEVKLESNEPAIDEIICNTNIRAEITNQYIKDENVYFEGIVTSDLIYIDENKERSSKTIEVPFVINSKIKMDKIDSSHHSISITDCKVRAKRGTIIDVQYSLSINFCAYIIDSKPMVDNITIGKPIEYGDIDYQIFLAKPNESVWELCKRIHIHPDDLPKYNKDLPLIMNGGEKVIIKR